MDPLAAKNVVQFKCTPLTWVVHQKNVRRDGIVELIQQPNNWTCGAAALAMCVNRTLQEITDRLGHDGSEVINPDGANITWQVAGFTTSELALAALSFNHALVDVQTAPSYTNGVAVANWPTVPELLNAWPIGQRFVLTVQSQRFAGSWHCVAYELGQSVYHDPQCDAPQPLRLLPPVGWITAVMPIPKTCRSCKHWDTSGLGSCCGTVPEGCGTCYKITSESSMGDVAHTFAGYDLITKPTFGCMLWEAKDGAECA